MFGAHFPLDVLVGAVVGYELGLFSSALLAKTPLLPARAVPAVRLLWSPAAEESSRP
jgi:membrane-associated phospholipid phosphatase